LLFPISGPLMIFGPTASPSLVDSGPRRAKIAG
jgi:hypothetical protein